MTWVLRVLRAMIALYLTAAVGVVIFSKLARGRRGDWIRQFNRDTLNPWMMQRAGGEHWYASCVRHVGRVSGRTYETPVVMHEVDGHLAIPLPYGLDVDWLENLRHAGGGMAVHKGVEYALSEVTVVSRDEISDALGARDTFRYRVLGIDDFVRLRAERANTESVVAV